MVSTFYVVPSEGVSMILVNLYINPELEVFYSSVRSIPIVFIVSFCVWQLGGKTRPIRARLCSRLHFKIQVNLYINPVLEVFYSSVRSIPIVFIVSFCVWQSRGQNSAYPSSAM